MNGKCQTFAFYSCTRSVLATHSSAFSVHGRFCHCA
jgi:hypothetical protein